MSALTSIRTVALRRGIHRQSATTKSLQQRAATAALLHTTTARRQPYKDDMDRTSLKPKNTEYSQSGSDEQAAQHPDAFNPRNTSPEGSRAAASGSSKASSSSGGGNGKDGDTNPLDVSPANRDLAESGRGKDEDRVPKASKGPSSHSGDAPKSGKVNPAPKKTKTNL